MKVTTTEYRTFKPNQDLIVNSEIKKLNVYTTDDGKVFYNENEATEHENYIKQYDIDKKKFNIKNIIDINGISREWFLLHNHTDLVNLLCFINKYKYNGYLSETIKINDNQYPCIINYFVGGHGALLYTIIESGVFE